MYFDGQNLEAETEDEANRLMAAIRELGAAQITENVDCHTVKVSNFTFIVQQGNSGFVTMTGLDEQSDKKLNDLYVACGERPQDAHL